MSQKIVIIGGSAAGPKSAAKARRLDQNAEITIIQKDNDLSMASCGYPYYIGGTFNERKSLLSTPTGVVRDEKFFKKVKNIIAKTNTEVTLIDPAKNEIHCKHLKTGAMEILNYNKCIIATGSCPVIPPLPGNDLNGITTLQSMQDTDYLRKICEEKKVKNAVVIGGGLIGIETSEALKKSGINVTIIEMLPQIMNFLDHEIAKIVENHLVSKGVKIITNNGLSEFLGQSGKLEGVKLQNEETIECELAVVAVGVKPNTKLADNAGIKTGFFGGIIVDEYMQTNIPNVYAAGDCTETKNIITEKQTYAPFGDLANLQGRVAGENAALGNSVTFPGTAHTGICKVFDYTAGSTGLSEQKAKSLGITDIETVINASPDKPGFMGAKLLISKMVVNKENKQIIGYQAVGPGDVSKQLATAAMAIQGKLNISNLVNLDLPYAPPFSLAIDHFIASSHLMQNKLLNRLNSISATEVYNKIKNKEDIFLLDVRGPDEYEAMNLGVSEVLIPLGMLQDKLSELPQNKNQEIICYCKISLRGYEASLILQAKGWNNVKVMEGGIMAWPFPRKK